MCKLPNIVAGAMRRQPTALGVLEASTLPRGSQSHCKMQD